MEYMPDFQVLRPTTIDDAVAAFASHPEARYVAGGTDLIVNIRRGIAAPKTLIDLAAIDGMDTIEATDDGTLRIGAGVTLNDLLKNTIIATDYLAIADAAAVVAAPTHRNVATVGGNLCLDTRCVYFNQSEWWRESNAYCLKYKGDVCHVAPSGDFCFAAFSGDLAPALLVFGATVDIVGPEGLRTLPLGDMYVDDGAAHLALGPGDLVTAVRLPGAGKGISGYAKVRVRDSIDFPLAGIAMNITRDGENLSALSVALTGLNSCPKLLTGTAGMIGKPLNEEALVALLGKQIQPMSSTFTPPGYRRKVAANLTRALARRLFDAA